MNTLISIPFFSLSAPCQKRTLRFLSRLAVVFILFASPAFSQFTHPQVGEGLTAGKVTCIVQDQRGFIWLGSDHGITRYDGYNYKAFRHNPDNNHSPSANEVRALCLDTAGKIWIGTLKGLDYFDPVTETFSHYVHRPEDPGSISSDQVTSLFRDSRGSVWVGTRFGGLNQVVSPKTAETKPAHRFRKFKPFSPVPGQTRGAFSISSITEDNKGSLWIGTVGGGLHSLHPVSGATKLHRSTISGIVPDSDLDVYAVRADAAGNIWLGTDKYGLYRIDAHTRQWKAFNPPAGKLEDDAHQIVEDTPGVFWIGTWQGGLYQLDAGKEQWTHYSAGEGTGSLSSNKIQTIYRDGTGNIWISTWGGGINLYNRAMPWFGHFFSESTHKLPGRTMISGLTENPAGTLWLGVVGEGLVKLDRSTQAYTTYRHNPANRNSLANDYMTAVMADQTGTIWVSTFRGLSNFNPKTGRFTTYTNNPADPGSIAPGAVVAMLQDRQGRYWLGTAFDGLDCLDPETGKFTHFRHDSARSESISSNSVTALLQAKDGTLWAGTDGGGLNQLVSTTGVFTRYSKQSDGLSSNRISAIAEGENGILWIGTFDQGLTKFDRVRNTFTHYQKGLPDNGIFSIQTDQKQNVWLTTNKGISRLDPRSGVIRNFDQRDGLQSSEYHQGTGFKNQRGELFFGSINGFTVFHPDSITENKVIPPVVLTDFKLLNKSVSTLAQLNGQPADFSLPVSISENPELTLPYWGNVFSLEFAALSYLFPEKNQYRYKLDGFDPHWIQSNNRRFAIYTNLDPGTYTFRVQGSNNDGVWNTTGTSLRIRVLPPFYRTWWAWLFYIAATCSLLYVVFRYFLYQERLKNALQLERIESDKLHEIDNLKTRFFANISHEFRTPLTLILGPVESRLAGLPDGHPDKSDFKLMHRSARRLLTLINQLLDLSKLEAGSLKLESAEGNLLAFIKAMVYSFSSLAESKQIHLTFATDCKAMPAYFDKDKVEKVVTNLLSNALKFTAEGGSVSVEVSLLSTGETSVTRSGIGTASRQSFAVISISDTGIGIPADRLDKIFDRFYQVDGTNTREHSGTGIGLALTQELVHLQGGTIYVQSEVGKGTRFTVRLPLREDKLTGTPLPLTEDGTSEPVWVPASSPATSVIGEPEPDQAAMSGPLLLIVEDNEEVRQYIHDVFAREYRVLEAKNGEEGLKMATDNIPDVVITDLMMPRMDGVELCRHLKTDERTSHIPLILLTARASEESRLDGLDTGADDYITKPFHVHELLLRVRNLVASRRQLRERFTREVKLQPRDIAITSADEKFLMVAIATVEKHMADSEFSVEALEGEMALSKMQLYRKLKALTDQSPNEFIRTIRLKRAAALLTARSGTVTEIAYEVGFNNLSYFAKCFREMYGVTPSEFTGQPAAPVK